ncbi:ATP-grasp domain-containing protein [Streptomyces sp. NBC_00102]|uniref:ATP-grasp domain-containing protein n=1 Tax=Streptomyces sp. NBC_00102 TaxID=2975652 RepID=UPI002259EA3E|nr:ATP-grasp domain-containing protein [Streptomyces sp. NBC_00102]MCX5395462.1 ATP-grasp domain-containing protein [Streptomyces sp. NBC_00102]
MPGFLLCADPLRPGRPDPAFTEEASAAREMGAAIALLDHDALLAGDAVAAVARVPRGSGAYWYRGWMIPVRHYTELDRALAERGASLLTDAAAYRTAHELPGWYDTFVSLTPRSVWYPVSVTAPTAVPRDGGFWSVLAQPLGGGPGIVKDFVKSRKHEWHEACFVPELNDSETLSAVVARMVDLQGEHLAGGVVVRAYERFVPGGEARVWWVDGEPVLVTAHPDTPGDRPVPELGPVGEAVRGLGCRLVTTDLALREDGVWRVIEVGDGQVSGLPSGTDARLLLEALRDT